MSNALEILVKVIDQATGPLKGIKDGLDGLQGSDVGKGMQKIGSQMMKAGGMMTAGVTMPLLAMGGVAAKAAIDFESSMSEVSKATNLEGAPLQAIGDNLLKMSRIPGMPAVSELAEMGAAGGRLGVASDSLEDFIGLTARMSTAFDISAEAAGQSAAEISANYKMMDPSGQIDFGRLETYGNVVNNLADNMATTEANVINFTKRVSGIATTYGVAESEAAALGAAFTSLGIAPEKAATAFNSTAGSLAMATELGGKAQEGFKALGIDAAAMQQAFEQGNGTDAYMDFLKTVSQAGPEAGAALTKIFGKGFSDEILQAAGGIEQFESAFNRASEAVAGGGATMQSSFDIAAKTTASQLQALQNGFQEIAIRVGSAMLPAINDLVDGIMPLVSGFADFAAAHPGIVQVGVAIAGVVAAIGPLIVGVGAVVGAIGTMVTAFSAGGALAAVGPAIAAAFAGLGGIIMAAIAPIGGVLLSVFAALLPAIAIAGVAIAALGAAFVLAGGQMSDIGPVLQIAQQRLAQFPQNLAQIPSAIGSVFGMIGSYFTLFGAQIGLVFAQIKTQIMSAFTGLGAAIMPTLMAIGMQIQAFFMQISMAAMQIGATLSSAFTSALAGISAAFAGIGAMISGMMASISGAIASMVASISSGFAQIPGLIQGAMAQAVGVVQGAVGMFQAAGAALMQALASGIMSAVDSAISAVSGAVSQIRGMLPFSPAKYGPLSDLDKTGPALMGTMAAGIDAAPVLGQMEMAFRPLANMMAFSQLAQMPASVPAMASVSNFPASSLVTPAVSSVQQQAGSEARSGDTYHITIEVSGESGNARELAERIYEELDRIKEERDRLKY
ncbi:MAG: phage tail tape measure protein [Cyanobacteria bacterium SBLK]|nr:phage tail tape measure protein [Cyanobacteria bacterium SBLK]